MRKIYSLLLALLCTATTWAQMIEIGNVYQFQSQRNNAAAMTMPSSSGTLTATTMQDKNYAQYWLVEEGTTSGTYALYNVNFKKYIQPNTGTSGRWTASDTKSSATDLYISVENAESGLISIRFSEASTANTHNGAHHDAAGYIVSWEAVADASQWTPLCKGSTSEVNAQIEADAAELETVKAEAEELLAEANLSITSEKIALQVTDENAAGYLWANTYAADSEGVISYLIDGNNNTYFHTSWSGYATDGTKDYLEFDMGTGNSVQSLSFDYVTRHNAQTDYPTSITLLGSNDKATYEEIGTIGGNGISLPVGNTKSFDSPTFDNGNSYRYIRFQVNSTSRGDASIPYFHLAELNFYKETVTISDKYKNYVVGVSMLKATLESLTVSATPNDITNAIQELRTGINKCDISSKIAELQAAIDAADATDWGTEIGSYIKTTEIENAISTAEELIAGNSQEFEAITTATATLNNLLATAAVNMPVAGKTYILESAVNFTAGTMAMYSTGAGLYWKVLDDSDLSFYWYIEPVEEGYTIKNAGTEKYAGTSEWNSQVAEGDDAVTITISSLGDKQFNITAAYDYHCNGHSNGGGASGNIIGWDSNSTNSASAWRIVEADASGASYVEPGKYAIIPYPTKLSVIKEGNFALSNITAIAYTGEKMLQPAQDFAAQLAKVSGITIAVKEAGATAAEGEIWFGTDATLAEEGYTLVVGDTGIEIKAASFAGWFYGLQTLKQMLPREFFATEAQSGVEWAVPFLDINDQPRFGYRGYMLDIARHFFNKEEVMKILDIMALYKMNRFHWHLTDDQGWRIEIPEYPKLTEVGSIRERSFSNPGDGETFYDDTEYGRGMWYSKEDLKEVVAYALARNIEIMPEVDLPGHMVAAIAAYPEFSCDPTKTYEVRVNGGISHDVLNIGNDAVIDFLKCIMDNLADVFPYKYVHFGGDECPTGQWAVNQQCLDRVEELGLEGVHQLQSWLVEELGTYISTKYNKEIVVWDELLHNWNDDNSVKPVIMAWNSLGHSATAANRGMQSIIVPYQHLYLDFMQAYNADRFVDELYNGGWGDGDGYVNTVEEIYNLNPTSSLSGREDFAIGVQGNMWTETTNSIDEVEYQLLPRMLALAEINWLPADKKSWASFYKRMQSHDEILDALDYQYGKHYFEPTEYTAAESAMNEAEEILENSIRGGVGFPGAYVYDALELALNEASEENIEALQTAIDNYKSADIVQPTEGKMYQIVSASSYYKRQYEGSTMYQKGSGARFHYTPQVEPEELWQFVATEGGYTMKNIYSGEYLQMNTYNAAVTMGSDAGTAIRIDKATVATEDFTYIPGVVTISAVDGYSATVTGSVKRLSAQGSGNVFAKDDAALCYNGTWRIVEITDFTAQLQGLVNKCEIIEEKANPGEMGEYTQEAIDYLRNSIITPAKTTIAEGVVSEEQYNAYVALYHQFQMMEKTSLAQGLSEDCYYYLRNIWFSKYAAYSSSNSNVVPLAKGDGDEFLWSIVKNNDGTIKLYNKASGTAAYIASSGDGQTVKVGQDYAWALEERTLDGQTGICIIDATGTYSWYTNPGTWNYILLKPFWGACTWAFEQSTIEVPTAITDVKADAAAEGIYDLQGRKIENITSPGIYIINGKKMFVK